MKSYVEDKNLNQTYRLNIAHLVFSCLPNLTEELVQSNVISFLEVSLTHPNNNFSDNIIQLISTNIYSAEIPFLFVLDYFIEKVTQMKTEDIEKNRRSCVSIKDVVEKLFKKPDLFASASAPNSYLALYFLFQYEVNTHTYIDQFANDVVNYLNALKTPKSVKRLYDLPQSQTPDGNTKCVALIKALADMKLEDLGREGTTSTAPKDEAFRVATLHLVYKILSTFTTTFVVDCPDSFYHFLTAVIDPSLQIANCNTLVSIITKGFTEKSKEISLIKERDNWFAAGLDLIQRLMNLKENQSLAAAVAVDVLLIFFRALEKSADASVKSTYTPKLVSLLAKFCTHSDTSIQAKAMMESVPPGYDSFTLPTSKLRKKDK